ncbi:hypothetical protein D3C73_709090 [compost metagenome]
MANVPSVTTAVPNVPAPALTIIVEPASALPVIIISAASTAFTSSGIVIGDETDMLMGWPLLSLNAPAAICKVLPDPTNSSLKLISSVLVIAVDDRISTVSSAPSAV